MASCTQLESECVCRGATGWAWVDADARWAAQRPSKDRAWRYKKKEGCDRAGRACRMAHSSGSESLMSRR
jgi:hypothetical protein